MDDTFLQDEESSFEKATLKIKSDNVDSSNSKSNSTSVPLSVPGIPYARIDCHTFFSDRDDVIEKALADSKRDLLSSTEEDELLGTWMLTEISLWDTEKERLVLLTKHALYSIKYDLISLRILEYNRIPLLDIDSVISGPLVYPSASLLPHLNGFAEGFSCLLHSALRQEWSSFSPQPRNRNMPGLRLMWNKGQPLSLEKKWNPFAKNIPWLTFTSHPLYWHKGSESAKTKYDVHGLHLILLDLLPEHCEKLENPIVIENYVGLGSLVHNRTGLGFFKTRGKVSF